MTIYIHLWKCGKTKRVLNIETFLVSEFNSFLAFLLLALVPLIVCVWPQVCFLTPSTLLVTSYWKISRHWGPSLLTINSLFSLLKHMLMRKLYSFCCCMYKILALISEMVYVDLMKQNLCFDKDEWWRCGGWSIYSHQERRKLDLFCCCRCKNSVVNGEMVDVERGSILFVFTDM